MEFPAFDPVLLDLPGPLDIRFYGLMYVVGFVVGQVLLVRLAKARWFPVSADKVPDLIFYLVLGVILGGRVGYALFYDSGLMDPVKILKIWEGGLSFHGGMLGVGVAFLLFARKHKTSAWALGDGCALVVTPGIFCVRIANFVNGELYGRETTADTFGATQFPTDPVAKLHLGLHGIRDQRAIELGIQSAYSGSTEKIFNHGSVAPIFKGATPDLPYLAIKERIPEIPLPEPAQIPGFSETLRWSQFSRSDPALAQHADQLTWDQALDWEAARAHVPHRHPSQLYEALGEGIVLGLLLWIVWAVVHKRRDLGSGGYCGLFLIGYGTVRWFIEFLRKPDDQFFTRSNPDGSVFLGMTMGQTLCAAMVLGGVWLMWWSRRHPRPQQPEESEPKDAGSAAPVPEGA